MVYCVDFVVHPASCPELPVLFSQYRNLNVWKCYRHPFDDSFPLAPPLENAWHEARLRWGWRLWRRFDTFRLLAGKIKETKGKPFFKELPEFPSKGNPITGMVKKKEQALHRVTILNTWMNAVYSHPDLLVDSACRGFGSEAVDHADNVPANMIPERSAAASAMVPDKVLSGSEWLQARGEAVALAIEAKISLEATFDEDLKGVVRELQMASVSRQANLAERKIKIGQNVTDLEANLHAAQARSKAQTPFGAREYLPVPVEETEWQTLWQALRKEIGDNITQADQDANGARAQMMEIMAQARALADSISALRIQVNSELWWLLAWTGRFNMDPEASLALLATMPEDDEKRRAHIAKANIPTPNTPTLIPAGTRLTQRLRKIHHRFLDIRALKFEWDLAHQALLAETDVIKGEVTTLGIADGLARSYIEEVAAEGRVRAQKEELIQVTSNLLDQIVEEDSRAADHSAAQNKDRVKLVPERRQVRKSLQATFQKCLSNVMNRLKGQAVRMDEVQARFREQTSTDTVVLYGKELDRDAAERAIDGEVAEAMRVAQLESSKAWTEQTHEGMRAIAENENGTQAARSSLNCVHAGLRLSALLGVGDGLSAATSFVHHYGKQVMEKPPPLTISSSLGGTIEVTGVACPSCQTINSGAFCLACGTQVSVPPPVNSRHPKGSGILMVDSGAVASVSTASTAPCASCAVTQMTGYCLQCGKKREVASVEGGTLEPCVWLPSMTGTPLPAPQSYVSTSTAHTETITRRASGSSTALTCTSCHAVADPSVGAFCATCGATLPLVDEPHAPPPPPPPPPTPEAPPSPRSRSHSGSLAHSLSSVGHEISRGSMDETSDLPRTLSETLSSADTTSRNPPPPPPLPSSSLNSEPALEHDSQTRLSQSHLASSDLSHISPNAVANPSSSSDHSHEANSSTLHTDTHVSNGAVSLVLSIEATALPSLSSSEASSGLTTSLLLTPAAHVVVLEEKEDDSAPENTVITQACESLSSLSDPVEEDKVIEAVKRFAPAKWSNDPWILPRAVASVRTMRKQLALRDDLKSLLASLHTTQDELGIAQTEIKEWESMLTSANQSVMELLQAVSHEQQQAEAERACAAQKRRNAQEHLDRAHAKLQTILPQIPSREIGLAARRTAAESRTASLAPANAEAAARQNALSSLIKQQAARMEDETARLTRVSGSGGVVLWNDQLSRSQQRSETVFALQDASRLAEEQLRFFETANEGALRSKALSETSLAEVNTLYAALSSPDMSGSEAERYSSWELLNGTPIAVNVEENTSPDGEYLIVLRKQRENLLDQTKTNLEKLSEEKRQLETETKNTTLQVEAINESLKLLRQESEQRSQLMQDLAREAETVARIQSISDAKCLEYSKAFSIFQGRVSTVEVALQGGIARRENQANRAQAMLNFQSEEAKLDPQQNVTNMAEVQGMQQANATDKQSVFDFNAISTTAKKSLEDLPADVDAWAENIVFEGNAKDFASSLQRALREQYDSRNEIKERAQSVKKLLQDELPKVSQEQTILLTETQKLQELTEMYKNLPPLKNAEPIMQSIPNEVVLNPQSATITPVIVLAPSSSQSAPVVTTIPVVVVTPPSGIAPAAGVKCGQCGANGQTGSFCLRCGSTVGSGPRCEYCGAGSQTGPSCLQCGKVLKSALGRTSSNESRASAGSITSSPQSIPSRHPSISSLGPTSSFKVSSSPTVPYSNSTFPSQSGYSNPAPPSPHAGGVTCFQCGTPGQNGFCQQCGTNLRAQPMLPAVAASSWMCNRCGVGGQIGGFCSGCGNSRPSVAAPTTSTCGSCRTPNQSGVFCMICGTKLAATSPHTQPARGSIISDTCAQCGATGQLGTACALCGTALTSSASISPAPRSCPGCASPNQTGAFCLNCGFKLTAGAVTPPVVTTTKLAGPRVCQACGKPGGDKAFCLYCGKKQ